MTDLSNGSGGDGSRQSCERLDALFEALADTRRRRVVCYFRQRDEDVASVDDLVDFAVGAEPGVTRDEIERSFRHIVLPKLADLGVVEYDARTRTVRYCGSPTIARLLAVATEDVRPAE